MKENRRAPSPCKVLWKTPKNVDHKKANPSVYAPFEQRRHPAVANDSNASTKRNARIKLYTSRAEAKQLSLDYKNNLRLEGVVVADATVDLYKGKEYLHFDLAVRRPPLGSQGNFLKAKDIFPIIAELKRHLHAKLLRKGEWIAVDGALGLHHVSVRQNRSTMHIKADRLSMLREKYYDNKVRLEGLVLEEPIRKMIGRENVLTFELGVRARDKVDLKTGESISTIDKFPIVVDPYFPPDQHIEQHKMIAVEGIVWAEPMTIEGISCSHIATRILRLRVLGPLLANRTRDPVSSELAHLI